MPSGGVRISLRTSNERQNGVFFSSFIPNNTRDFEKCLMNVCTFIINRFSKLVGSAQIREFVLRPCQVPPLISLPHICTIKPHTAARVCEKINKWLSFRFNPKSKSTTPFQAMHSIIIEIQILFQILRWEKKKIHRLANSVCSQFCLHPSTFVGQPNILCFPILAVLGHSDVTAASNLSVFILR